MWPPPRLSSTASGTLASTSDPNGSQLTTASTLPPCRADARFPGGTLRTVTLSRGMPFFSSTTPRYSSPVPPTGVPIFLPARSSTFVMPEPLRARC